MPCSTRSYSIHRFRSLSGISSPDIMRGKGPCPAIQLIPGCSESFPFRAHPTARIFYAVA
jgi:hypothetical protein